LYKKAGFPQKSRLYIKCGFALDRRLKIRYNIRGDYYFESISEGR
jgi:hypothetical protein